MSENGFQPGPYMKRGPGALSKNDTQTNFDVYNEAISALQQQVKDLQKSAGVAWASSQAATEGGGHAPGAPALSASGNPVYIEDPAHPGSWILNPVTPPNPLWWLHDNHTDQGSGDDNLTPHTVLRITLADGTNRSDGAVSVFLGLVVTTPADDLSAASVRTLQATVALTQEDCDAGFVDVRAPSGIKVDDVVDCVIVAAWNAIGYAEASYIIGAREYIAGFGPPLPETPVFTTIQRNVHHVKAKLVLQGPYDLTAPYTEPGCINYYDSVELWSRDEYADDGTTPCSGVHPDDSDAVGWEQEPNVGIKRIIRKVGQETKAGKPTASQHRNIAVVVQRNKGGKKWLAFRYRDRFGRVGPWANITPTTMGTDSGTAPGYVLATAGYLPGGASNPLSNAATDPAVGFWNADDDNPNTAAREVSARIRFYFTDPATGTAPVANANNRHFSVVVREQRANGRVIRHAPTVDIENDTEAHGSETYVDVHFLRKFRHGAALKIKSAAVHGNGFKNEMVFSGLDFYAGGGQIAAPQPPVVGTPTHTKMATIVPISLPNDTTAGHLQVFVAPAGTPQNPDTYKTAFVKVKGLDIADDIKQGRLNLEVHLARPNAYKKVIACRIKSKYDPDLFSTWVFPSDTGTVPDTDDTAPAVPTLALASVVNDKTGTAKKECDLTVTATWVSCHEIDIEILEWDPSASKVVQNFVHHLAVKDGVSTATKVFKRLGEKGDIFYARVRGKVGTAYSAWSCADGAGGWGSLPPVGAYSIAAGGGTPLVTAPTATPSQGAPPLHVVFAANASGGSGSYTYDWDYGDGSAHGTTATPSHNYAAGTWAAILTVTDSAGQKVTAPAIMIMAGLSGMPVPVLTADTTHGAPPLAVTFTRVATGGTAPYAGNVDYGDGTTPLAFTGWNGESTVLSAHNYTTAGTRTAILTVTDAAGVTAKIELAIFVGVPVTPSAFAIAAGAMTSAVVKIPGSTASRCDATCPFTVSNAVSCIATLSDGTKTYKATAECSGGSGTFYWPAHFKRGLTLTVTSVELINGQSRATVSTPTNGTCTAGASAAPTPGVVTVGAVETKLRANLYQLTFASDATLTWCEIFKGASGATGTPDSNPTAWKALAPIKLFTRDSNGDPVCNMTTAEARVGHAQGATIDVQFRLENIYGIKGAFVKSSGAAPADSDDTAPTIGTITGTTWEDDVPGTPGKECDVEITVPWTGDANWVRAEISATLNGATKKLHKRVDFAKATNGSQTVLFRRKFKRGASLSVTAIAGMGTAQSAVSNILALTAGGGAIATPAAPTITSVTYVKRGALLVITLPNDSNAGILQIYKANTGETSYPDYPAVGTVDPTKWKKIAAEDVVDEIAAGLFVVEKHITLVAGARKAFCARIRSRYDRTVFSTWSAIYDAGTVPNTDDTPPDSVSITLQSPLDDIAGTTKKECSLGATFSVGGTADKVKAVFKDTTSGRLFTLESSWPTGDASSTLWIERKLTAGHIIQCVKCRAWNGTASVDAVSLPSIIAGSGTVSGGVPSAPTLASPYISLASGTVSPHTAEFDIWWSSASYPYLHELRIQRQNVAGTGWSEESPVVIENLVKAGINTVRVKMHWERRISNTNVPQIQVAAVDSFGNASGFYVWSNSGVIQPSPLDYFQDSQGQLQGGNVNLSVNGTTENLNSKMVCAFAGGANHIFFDADNVWPTDAIAQANLPLSSSSGIIASGRIVPVWNASGTAAARFRLAVYFPNSLTGVGANKWALFKADQTLDLDGGSDPGDAPPTYTAPPLSGGACFAPETLILLDDGTARAIQDVQPGDSILGVDPVTGGLTPTPALVLSDHPESGDVDGVVLMGVRVTPDHQVAAFAPGTPAAAGPWVAVGRLVAGHALCGLVQGKAARLEAPEDMPHCAPFHPYNLTTGTHNFFVSSDGVTWLLVSNTKTLA